LAWWTPVPPGSARTTRSRIGGGPVTASAGTDARGVASSVGSGGRGTVARVVVGWAVAGGTSAKRGPSSRAQAASTTTTSTASAASGVTLVDRFAARIRMGTGP
jgi:hypothetical protein